jgi:hypothetical protein
LKVNQDELLSSFAFTFNVRRYASAVGTLVLMLGIGACVVMRQAAGPASHPTRFE